MFLFGVIMPFAIGFLYMIPICICTKYYIKDKGLVTGIILGAFGFSGVIL